MTGKSLDLLEKEYDEEMELHRIAEEEEELEAERASGIFIESQIRGCSCR